MIHFKAKIYKVGINTCVDVPVSVTKKMTVTKGYIKVKGTINGFSFTKTLVPVKKAPYRLFVNIPMLKGSESKMGDIVNFSIEQDFKKVKKEYPMPPSLHRQLKDMKLLEDFTNLTVSRKTDILKYLSYIKTEDTLQKNISKIIKKLEAKEKTIRIP
jgi:hypothetical protein